MQFALVPPALMLGFQCDSAFWFTVLPTSATTCTLTTAYLFPKSTVESPSFRRILEMAELGLEIFNGRTCLPIQLCSADAIQLCTPGPLFMAGICPGEYQYLAD